MTKYFITFSNNVTGGAFLEFDNETDALETLQILRNWAAHNYTFEIIQVPWLDIKNGEVLAK